ncbi:MAG: hypothetical protein ACI86M_002173 [Saprospiraceae bacterium]|jgi:hypothetical protein
MQYLRMDGIVIFLHIKLITSNHQIRPQPLKKIDNIKLARKVK